MSAGFYRYVITPRLLPFVAGLLLRRLRVTSCFRRASNIHGVQRVTRLMLPPFEVRFSSHTFHVTCFRDVTQAHHFLCRMQFAQRRRYHDGSALAQRPDARRVCVARCACAARVILQRVVRRTPCAHAPRLRSRQKRVYVDSCAAQTDSMPFIADVPQPSVPLTHGATIARCYQRRHGATYRRAKIWRLRASAERCCWLRC